jgi:simple sugar transport system ATP-binding protein
MSTPIKPPTVETEQPVMNAAEDLVTVEDASLSFGAVRALREVSLTLRSGEITALVGDNGAGKSTLVRCLSGIHKPNSGQITLDGDVVHFHTPDDARNAGIETVHQNLALVEDLTVWQNLFLNREKFIGKFPFRLLDRRGMKRGADQMVSALAVNVPAVTSRVRRLSGGQRQAVSSAGQPVSAPSSSSWTSRQQPWASRRPRKSKNSSASYATTATPCC